MHHLLMTLGIPVSISLILLQIQYPEAITVCGRHAEARMIGLGRWMWRHRAVLSIALVLLLIVFMVDHAQAQSTNPWETAETKVQSVTTNMQRIIRSIAALVFVIAFLVMMVMRNNTAVLVFCAFILLGCIGAAISPGIVSWIYSGIQSDASQATSGAGSFNQQ